MKNLESTDRLTAVRINSPRAPRGLLRKNRSGATFRHLWKKVGLGAILSTFELLLFLH